MAAAPRKRIDPFDGYEPPPRAKMSARRYRTRVDPFSQQPPEQAAEVIELPRREPTDEPSADPGVEDTWGPIDPYPEVTGRTITGNGMAGIRDWVLAVQCHYGGDRLALCNYASVLGYHANLKTFRVEISDRALAKAMGRHRSRIQGHGKRLVKDGFITKVPKKRGEKGTDLVLALPAEQPTDGLAPF